MNIDLSKYKLVRPELIQRFDGCDSFYDIEVEDDNTFHIVGDNDLILSHNCDGDSITGSLLNFFYKYWPEMYERKMIYKVDTPLIVAISKTKTKNKLYFYTQDEYNLWYEKTNLKDWEIDYKKGLAALVDDEYNDIINKPRLVLITKDDLSKESLNIWFGKNSELRKNELLKDN